MNVGWQHKCCSLPAKVMLLGIFSSLRPQSPWFKGIVFEIYSIYWNIVLLCIFFWHQIKWNGSAGDKVVNVCRIFATELQWVCNDFFYFWGQYRFLSLKFYLKLILFGWIEKKDEAPSHRQRTLRPLRAHKWPINPSFPLRKSALIANIAILATPINA